MHGAFAGRVDNLVEHGASALFGAAVGYAAYAALGVALPMPSAVGMAAAITLFATLLCAGILRASAAGRRFAMADFALPELETVEPDELLLTDRVEGAGEPLVLDDILAEIGPDSRVVRLFDRHAMPTPGQLKSRIDNHLGQPQPDSPDASQALIDALAELRRALR